MLERKPDSALHCDSTMRSMPHISAAIRCRQSHTNRFLKRIPLAGFSERQVYELQATIGDFSGDQALLQGRINALLTSLGELHSHRDEAAFEVPVDLIRQAQLALRAATHAHRL